MNRKWTGYLTVLGRFLISMIFLMSAVGNKIPNFATTAEHMAAEGIPMAPFMLIGAIFFLIAGSLSVMLGFRVRIGANLLLVFLILATFFFHDFWTMEGLEAQLQMVQFMKNLSMMGAMLFLIANGAGPMSLDNRSGGAKN